MATIKQRIHKYNGTSYDLIHYETEASLVVYGDTNVAAVLDALSTNYAAKSHNHAASNITSGTLGVARGGTGATTFTSGNALIGAGTGAVTTKAIDSTSGGTASSNSLITSGAVNSGLAGKANSTHSHFASTPTTGQVVVTDGTAGGLKTTGYTIAKSVPSTAVFTDTNTTYTFATGDSNGQIKVTPSSGSASNIAVKGLDSAAYTASTDYAKPYLAFYANQAVATVYYVTTNITASNTGTIWVHGEIIGTKGTSNISFVRFAARCYKIDADSGEAYSLRYWDPLDVISSFTLNFDANRKVYFTFTVTEQYSRIKLFVDKDASNGNTNYATEISTTAPATFTKSANGVKYYSSLATSGVTAATKGPTANVTGTDGTTIKVPSITVDAYGRVTALSEYTLTNKNTTYSNFVKSGSTAAAGLVPSPGTTAGTTKYLREDATWAVPPNDNTVYTHPTTSGNKHIPSGGSSGQFLKWSADGTAVWAADNNTTYSNFTGASSSAAGSNGLVPAPAKGDQVKYLCGNATWDTASDIINTLSEGTANAQEDDYLVAQYAGGGTSTITYHRRPVNKVVNATVVKAALGTGTGTTKYLREDGTWQVPPDTNTVYTHPTTAGNKHIPSGGSSGQFLGWDSAGTAKWVANPNTNTTYTFATGSTNGTISVTPSGGSASNIAVKGLGSAAYTASTAYAAASHNHSGAEITSGTVAAARLADYPEARLIWGGKNFSAGYGPIDAAMIPELGANRFAFLKAAGITIEYSTNGGSSFTDYGSTDANKVGLFSIGSSHYLGKHTSKGTNTTSDQLRVTINTGTASCYSVLNKIVIYMSTNGNTTSVKIEKALESTPTTFTTHLDWTGISGWSGWNILNIDGITTYGNSAASQYGRIRLTFRQTAVNTNYASANISIIQAYGGMGWTVPSNMAKFGHLYTYDSSQNATFPAKVTATDYAGKVAGKTVGTASIGSASAGTAIAADDITAWSAGTAASASIASGVLTITNGTAPSLSYTARSIPNISVTSKTVFTAS